MPLYTFDCGEGHSFDRIARYTDTALPCDHENCHASARRREFYSQNAVVEGSIPPADTPERTEHDKRALKTTGWDYDRALEHVRSSRSTDREGNMVLDPKKLASYRQ
jgi:hypothetical protein